MTSETSSSPEPGSGALPALDKPRFTSAHIVRWVAAQQNWDRLHFDQDFCRSTARLELPVINGALKQHLIVQLLQRAFPCGWPWRVDYKFQAPDFVGEKLQVRGSVADRVRSNGHIFIRVRVEIANLTRDRVTTTGSAVVLMAPDDARVLDALSVHAPDGMELSQSPAAPDGSVSAEVEARLGTLLQQRESKYGIDLSRLRLFADAVMDLDRAHFDPDAASPWGAVVAPPLFPLHGLEADPGSFPLSEESQAQGREGVNEIGRDVGALLGLDAIVGLNAGNRVQVHSLARVGERIRARSTLASVRKRIVARGGQMIFVETLNDYSEVGGRPLLTERQTMAFDVAEGTT